MGTTGRWEIRMRYGNSSPCSNLTAIKTKNPADFPVRGLCKKILLKYPHQIQNPQEIPSFFPTGGLYRKIFPSDPHFLHITGYNHTIFIYRPPPSQEQETHRHFPPKKGYKTTFFLYRPSKPSSTFRFSVSSGRGQGGWLHGLRPRCDFS